MHGATIKRFLGYRRVSTGEQGTAGTSLDGQKEELAQLAASLHAPVVLDFVEVESGAAEKEERRVEVAKLLDAVRPGDVVAVAKFDRFTRDLEFAIRKVREILGKGGRFISIAEGEFENTPEGELKLSIWASIAQMERARIRDRTCGQKIRLRKQGAFVEGLPPLGYTRAKGRDAHDKPRRLEIDPSKAPIIVEMFDLCVRGVSLRDIVRHLRTKFPGTPFKRSWAGRTLGNRLYTGQVATTPVRTSKGNYRQAAAQWVDAHEPIVPMELWLRAQAALQGRRIGGDKPRSGSGTETFLLRGLVTCGVCGATVSGVPVYSKSPKHGYYACRQRTHPSETRTPVVRCPAPYVRHPEIDAHVEHATLARLSELGDLLAAAPERKPDAPDFGKMRAAIAARRSRLVTAVAAGKLGLDDIDAPLAELDAELADLETAAAEHAARVSGDSAESRRAALAFVGGVTEAWAGLTLSERRSIIAILAERIVFTGEGKIALTWRDASGLSASVSSARPEVVGRLARPEVEPGPDPGASMLVGSTQPGAVAPTGAAKADGVVRVAPTKADAVARRASHAAQAHPGRDSSRRTRRAGSSAGSEASST